MCIKIQDLFLYDLILFSGIYSKCIRSEKYTP